MTPAIFLTGALLMLSQLRTPERDLAVVRSHYEVGNYAAALKHAREALAVHNFSDAQRIDLNLYAGLSAFNLGELPDAETFLLRLLRLNPDYVLDPLAIPPPAIRFVDELRAKHQTELDIVRNQLALQERLERQRRNATEPRRGTAQARTPPAAPPPAVPPAIVNLLPFGIGQLQQKRQGLGLALAISQGVLAATSIVSFWAVQGQLKLENYPLGGPSDRTVPLRGVPPARWHIYRAWDVTKYASGAAFYLLWAAGALEASLHQPRVSSQGPGQDQDQGRKGPVTFVTPQPSGGVVAGVEIPL